MKQSIRIIGSLLLAIGLGTLAGCGGGGGGTAATQPATPAKYVFVNDDNATANTVSAFSIDQTTGALTSITGSPFATGGTGSASGYFADKNIALDKTNNLLFATNHGSNDISVFSIDPATGALTPITGSPFANATGATMGYGGSMAVNSAGTLLFVGNDTSSNISVFSIAAGGALTPITGSPFATGFATAGVDGIRLNQAGTQLIVANGNDVYVGVYDVAAGGALTAATGSPFNLGASIVPYDVDGNAAGINIVSPSGALYSYDASYTQLSSLTLAGSNDQCVSFAPDGTWLIDSGGASSTFAVVGVDAAGALSQIATGTAASGYSFAGYAAIDPNGKWVYATEVVAGNNFVEGFAIDTTAATATSLGAPATAGVGSPKGIALY